jgi:hypothetical protein
MDNMDNNDVKNLARMVFVAFFCFVFFVLSLLQKIYPFVIMEIIRYSCGCIVVVVLLFLCGDITKNKGLKRILIKFLFFFLVVIFLNGGIIIISMLNMVVLNHMIALAVGIMIISLLYITMIII